MTTKIKDALEAISIIELEESPEPDRYYAAFQYLIDTGIVWKLQGWYGRTAERLIQEEKCRPANVRAAE